MANRANLCGLESQLAVLQQVRQQIPGQFFSAQAFSASATFPGTDLQQSIALLPVPVVFSPMGGQQLISSHGERQAIEEQLSLPQSAHGDSDLALQVAGLDSHTDGGNQSAAAGEAAGEFGGAGAGGADSDALAGAGIAPIARPTPIRPTAARLPPSTVVLGELGRPTAFSVLPPVPAPSTPARGAGLGTQPSGATAGGATDSDALGESCAAATGNYLTSRRAEMNGAGTVTGWLVRLGLGRYAEALLGAGWDCAEVGAARALPPHAAARRAVFRKPPVEGATVLLPSLCGRATPRPGLGRGVALPPSRHPLPVSLRPAAHFSLKSRSSPVSGPRPRASPCTAAPLTAQATRFRAGGGGAAGGGPAAARGAARARAAHRRARPVPPPRRCRCRRQP